MKASSKQMFIIYEFWYNNYYRKKNTTKAPNQAVKDLQEENEKLRDRYKLSYISITSRLIYRSDNAFPITYPSHPCFELFNSSCIPSNKHIAN